MCQLCQGAGKENAFSLLCESVLVLKADIVSLLLMLALFINNVACGALTRYHVHLRLSLFQGYLITQLAARPCSHFVEKNCIGC